MRFCQTCGKKRTHSDHELGICAWVKPPTRWETEPRKRIKPRSKKMADFYKEERIPLVKAVLERDKYRCRIKADGCTGEATTVHEIKTRGRFGGIRARGVNTMENCIAACADCNLHVSEHSDWAEENGFLESNKGAA